MRLFFGKIKSVVDNQQINEAYYETLSPMKLGDLREGDYAFIISGRDVHLWKAKERIVLDGRTRMRFDVVQNYLALTSQKLVSFKYFLLNSTLIVLTVRQSPKAFYQIDFDSSFTEEMLTNPLTYENEDNFRKINVLSTPDEINHSSWDVQLYFEGDELKLFDNTFFDRGMSESFLNNLPLLGSGRKRKDRTLRKILDGRNSSSGYSYTQFSILSMYDALFTEYGNPVESDLDGNDGENTSEIAGIAELKTYNQIYYGPPGTGKTHLVLKNFCLEEEIVIPPSNRIKIDTTRNFWHLAPGRNGYLWDKLKGGNLLGYEWVDKSWGDIHKLTPKHIEDEGWGSFQLISYFKHVHKGDYICVISGRKLFGIAKVLTDYQYETAIDNNFDFQTVRVEWLKQFDQPVYLNSSQTKTFVRLNNGTRWSTLLTLLREHGFYFADEEAAKESTTVKSKNFSFITFHPSFSYEDFIEGIKPVLVDSEEGSTENLEYEIVPGIFYQACEKAAQLGGYESLQECLADNRSNREKKLNAAKEYYVLIDELNRGNVPSIFGELITLIEDDKRLGKDSEIISYLPYSKNLFGVPLNLRIIGTMNTVDRSVEALDTALRRRFSFEEVKPNPQILSTTVGDQDIDLRQLLVAINKRLEKLLNPDYTIGHSFFLKIETLETLRNVFANKIIPLLQEYFHGDYSKIGLVIGSSFLVINKEKSVFLKVKGVDLTDWEDKTVYSLQKIDDLSDEQFVHSIKSIYEE